MVSRPDQPSHDTRPHTQSVSRSIALLKALGSGSMPLSLSELAGRVHLHKATAHRLMRTLEGERLVARDPVSGKYWLGREIQVLASAVVAHDPLLREGQVALRALRDEIGHTCSLASLDGESIVFLLVEEGTRPIRVQWTRPGDRLPASTTAAGKVLLMDRSDAEVLRLVREHGLPRLTPKSITSRDVFLREIRRARREGLALAREEATIGLLAVATPVRRLGAAVAAVSVACPTNIVTPAELVRVCASLRASTAALSARLGGTERAAG
jgi:DNA-binding IclR family transcriptional regulator